MRQRTPSDTPGQPAPCAKPAKATARSQGGSIVIYLVVGLAAFGVLAMAGATRFGAVVTSVFSPNCATSARYMAESGLRYAMARLRACNDIACVTDAISNMNGKTVSVDAAKGLEFSLAASYNAADQTASVTSTGTGCKKISAVGKSLGATINLPVLKDVIDFSNIADDFFLPTDLKNKKSISVDPATQTINFGKIGELHNAASIWYAGNSTQGCVDGNCTMTNGFNSYFEVQWDSASIADGLVFGIISGETNTTQALGGDPDMGELMGWAGPGLSGYGLRPPKIGIELDTWYNACNSNQYRAASRCDPTTYSSLDHLAYVFWGSNTGASAITPGVYGSGRSYDDNRHGAGTGYSTEPVTSNDPDGSGSGQFGVYYTSTNNWLRGGTKYFFRHEITRLTTASSGSTYCYLLKSWIIKRTSANPDPPATMKDVTTDYDSVANPPSMQQVIFLDPTYHQQLSKVIFGWTEATGDYAQKITVGKFNLAFKKAQPSYGTAPAGATLYWPMYNNLGTSVSDASGSNRTGSINGTARWVPGIANNNGAALYFNGSTYVSAASDTALDLSKPGGVSLWFNPKAPSAGKWLLRKGSAVTTVNNYANGTSTTTNANTDSYGLYINSSGYLCFRLRYGTADASYREVVSTTMPSQDSWYHVAATWDGTSLKLYVNGIQEGSVATSGSAAQNSNDLLFLGASKTTLTTNVYRNNGTLRSTTTTTSYGYFTGLIDEVYLYKQMLTQANVTALATGKP